MRRLIFTLLVLATCSNSYGQNSSKISGYVANSDNQALCQALVSVMYQDELYSMTLTDSNGYYRVNILEPNNDTNIAYV